jgi:hypothetical protein
LEGAQRATAPVVGWPQATTGRPPLGAGPAGATTTADTTRSAPFWSVVWWSTRHATDPSIVLGSGSVRTMLPGAPGGTGSGSV